MVCSPTAPGVTTSSRTADERSVTATPPPISGLSYSCHMNRDVVIPGSLGIPRGRRLDG